MPSLAQIIQKNIHFLDEGFEQNLALEKQSRLFELLVCDCLNNGDLITLPWKKGGRTGPDFLLQQGNKKIWIECVKPKYKIYGGNDLNLRSEQISSQISSGLVAKGKKYKKYLDSNIISEEDYFIVAVSVGHLGDEIIEINGVGEVEFGSWLKFSCLGNTYHSLNLTTSEHFLQTQTPPKNKNQKHIDDGFFEKNKWLNGVLYCSGDEETSLIKGINGRIGFLGNDFSTLEGVKLECYLQSVNEEIILIQ